MRGSDLLLERKRAVYYPSITVIEDVTSFGLKKLLAPKNPYDSPLERSDKFIVKVDLLECFKDAWGENILLARDNIYELVSGDTTDERFAGLMCTYYKTHAAFANCISLMSVFGNQNISLLERFKEFTKGMLDNYRVELDKTFGHCKYLLEDRGYIYYAVNVGFSWDGVEGVTKIC